MRIIGVALFLILMYYSDMKKQVILSTAVTQKTFDAIEEHLDDLEEKHGIRPRRSQLIRRAVEDYLISVGAIQKINNPLA